jgi:hypothetical protein
MNGLTNNTSSVGNAKSHEFQVSLDKRFSHGFDFNLGYTGMMLRSADFFYNEFDASPTERVSNNGRPHRIVASGIYELPFGRGRHFFSHINKAANILLGGWQIAATYEWQPGPLLDWGNVFFYGNLAVFSKVDQTWDKWFNTDNFERVSTKAPTSFQARVFPTRVDGVRRDMTNQINANMSKNIKFGPEKHNWNLQLRLDALNVQNRSQMDAPSTDPLSTNFGKITAQTSATNRWLQVQARLTF